MRQLPPRHQVGQERAGRHRGQHGPGDSPPGGPGPAARGLRPPPQQADADTGGRVQQGVRPEEDRVRARPHLGRGVLADQAAHGGGGGAPARPGELRTHHVGGDRLAAPAQHGGRQVGEHDHPGLPGRFGVQQAGSVTRAADRHDLQVRRVGGGPGRGDHQRRPGRERRGDGGKSPSRRAGRRRSGGLRPGPAATPGQRRSAGSGPAAAAGRPPRRAAPAGNRSPARWSWPARARPRARPRPNSSRGPRRRPAGPTAGCCGTAG